MRTTARFRSTLALSATLAALAACGNNDSTTTGESTTSAGQLADAAPGNPATGTSANTDSMAGGTAMATNADLSGLATLPVEEQMSLLGASNAAEILTSEAAQGKLDNAQAKQFARDMITEHRAMQKMADQLATRLNVTPKANDMSTEKGRMANEMATQLKAAPASGASNGAQYVDRQYIDGQVLAHQRTLAELQAMQTTSNAEVATLVRGAIPKVQAHIERAQRIQAQLGGANAGMNNGANNGAVTGSGTQGSMSSSSPSGR